MNWFLFVQDGQGSSFQLCHRNELMKSSLNFTCSWFSGFVSLLLQRRKLNEEPAMRNLIIDGTAGGETKIRHDVTFPLLTLHR
jgi:hypothetical protein